MYIDKIRKEEENCINDILSEGIEEIKDLTQNCITKGKPLQLLKTSMITNANDINSNTTTNLIHSKIQMSDFNPKQKSSNEIAPKSSALRDLINQLKKENNYILSSEEDEEIDNVKLKQIYHQKEINQKINNFEESTNQFSSMKTQMDYIQNRIKKIKGTLYTNKNNSSNSISKINTDNLNQSNANDKDKYKDTNRSYSYKLKQKRRLYLNNDTSQISSSDLHHHPYHNNTNTTSTSNIHRITNRKEKKKTNTSIDSNKDAYRQYKQYSKDEDDNSSFNQGSPINYQLNNNYTLKAKTKSNDAITYFQPNNNHTHSSSALLSKFSWRQKYEDLKVKNNTQQIEISLERKKINQLEKTIKTNKKKNSNYSTLIDYNKQLISQEELLINQITESENIRKEQSKLIRSLQREIDMLRGDIDENNLNNIAEVYQSMKESLIESNNRQSA